MLNFPSFFFTSRRGEAHGDEIRWIIPEVSMSSNIRSNSSWYLHGIWRWRILKGLLFSCILIVWIAVVVAVYSRIQLMAIALSIVKIISFTMKMLKLGLLFFNFGLSFSWVSVLFVWFILNLSLFWFVTLWSTATTLCVTLFFVGKVLLLSVSTSFKSAIQLVIEPLSAQQLFISSLTDCSSSESLIILISSLCSIWLQNWLIWLPIVFINSSSDSLTVSSFCILTYRSVLIFGCW